jgi:hypothetical protein
MAGEPVGRNNQIQNTREFLRYLRLIYPPLPVHVPSTPTLSHTADRSTQPPAKIIDKARIRRPLHLEFTITPFLLDTDGSSLSGLIRSIRDNPTEWARRWTFFGCRPGQGCATSGIYTAWEFLISSAGIPRSDRGSQSQRSCTACCFGD